MSTFAFSRYAFSIGAAAALLAGCGASQLPSEYSPSGAAPPIGVKLAFPSRVDKAPNYRVLYDFGAPRHGSEPDAGLIDVGGTLYGTTAGGGAYSSYYGGTVFSITTTGREKVLHSFGAADDGSNPTAGLIDVDGTLYGTTSACSSGSYCGGTVFSMTTSGSEKVLHDFGASPDGNTPTAGLIDVNGTFYGTTDRGGANSCTSFGGCGTVFSITKDGTEKVLHSFGSKKDGAFPAAGLIEVNGTLYGTTSGGGKYGGKQKVPYGGGTVFSITTGGEEKVLHNFGWETDGAVPEANLIDVNGTLYGTTRIGGAYFNSCGNGIACGTIFSITTAGKEKVLYSFGYGYRNGCLPRAALVDLKGTLYGTASACGGYGRSEVGNGTIFSVTTGGKETTLHRFHGEGDGWRPLAGLINVSGTLYGTTAYGGNGYKRYGNGTVFALTP